ncbi:MAG: repair protein RecN [Paenibacillus sp.]|nr:repair protein RecN [Paenibacillus sp.]
MLRELSIRNLAVIEEVQISFHNGFHVLTGETGAGKSILIDALSLLVGGRGSSDMVRYGCDKAEMEALFDMQAHHPVWSILRRLGVQFSSEEMLVIRRELSAQGKSVSRVNGQLVTMTMLREIGESLVNIHGQHEHQSLLRSEQHLEWLDLFGGDLLIERKTQFKRAYGQLMDIRSALKELENTARHNVQMLDLYRFQIEEITAAELKPEEDELLMEQRKTLMYAEKRMDAASEAYTLLYGGKGLDAFSKAISKLTDIVNYDKKALSPLLEQLQSAFYQAEDAAFQLRDYRDGIDADPESLARIEERLDLIHGLKRKYGETIPDILCYLEKITDERDKIENRDELAAKFRAQEEEAYRHAYSLAQELSALRKHASVTLSDSIESQLGQLLMPSAKFRVSLEGATSDGGGDNQAAKLHGNGIDDAVFLLSSNPGEPLKPLNRIASGGEMSRIMLALKSIFAEIDQVPVLIFDEVDTGVSGRAAQAIAEKMSALSSKCQVFVSDGRTATSVTELATDKRINELARMLGGVEVTEKTRNHAQEMLDLAHGLKGA